MPPLRRLTSTYRTLFHTSAVERDLDEELRGCLDLREQELIGEGLSAEDARRTARLEFGGPEQLKEHVRETRRGGGLDTLRQDLRLGLRALRRDPLFAAITAATLAVAIGGTTAVVSTIDAALFRPVAYAESGRLFVGGKTVNGEDSGPVSRLDYLDFRQRSRSFEGLAATGVGPMPVSIEGGSEPWVADVGIVTWNLFRVLRVNPILGRGFLPDEESHERPSSVVISYDVWQSRFGGDAAILGRTISALGASATIVGVMPRGFRFLYDADIWIPVNRSGPWDPVRDSHSHWAVGRLAPGVSAGLAQQEVDTIATALAAEYPATNAGKGLRRTRSARRFGSGLRTGRSRWLESSATPG